MVVWVKSEESTREIIFCSSFLLALHYVGTPPPGGGGRVAEINGFRGCDEQSSRWFDSLVGDESLGWFRFIIERMINNYCEGPARVRLSMPTRTK